MSLQIQEPETEVRPVLALGIDLGTTHSLVGFVEKEIPRLLDLEGTGDPRVPSVVGFGAGGEVLCGTPARAREAEGLASVAGSLKRLLGLSSADPRLQKMASQRFAETGAGELAVVCGHMQLTPFDFSTHLLLYLKERAESTLGYVVSKAVITVPAYFGEAARSLTRQAAETAGFEVLRLLSEPTAAALAYGLDQGLEGLYGVYDLGGGTFDFSLLKMRQGVFDVVATTGDTFLGGDDIDRNLANILLGNAWDDQSPETQQRFITHCRRAKEALSNESQVSFDEGGQAYAVTREQLATASFPIIEKTNVALEELFRKCKVEPQALQGVLLVGGSTRVRVIQEAVTAFFGQEPLCSLNPDHVVALGAARQADALTYSARHLLLDVTPLTLGIELLDGQMEPLIVQNTRIPVRVTQTFTNGKDGQTTLRIHILQGNTERAEEACSLGYFDLEGIPPLPQNQARIAITFSLDVDGLLTVSAQEETTGVEQSVSLKPAYRLKNALRDTSFSSCG